MKTTDDATLYIGTPIAGSMIHVRYVASVTAAMKRWRCAWDISPGSYLPHNRGLIAANAIRSGATHALFIDSDIGFVVEDVEKLIVADRDFIGGVYAMKDGTGAVALDALPGAQVAGDEAPGGVVKINSIGFGFVLMKIDALARMSSRYEALAYEQRGRRFIDLFAPEPGTPETEDYAFCRRWNDIGGEVFVHTGVRLAHYGEKMYLPGVSVG